MIRTALKAGAVAAVLSGATLLATPAQASAKTDNHYTYNNVAVTVIGGYGVTNTSLAINGNSIANASHNHVTNTGNGQYADGAS